MEGLLSTGPTPSSFTSCEKGVIIVHPAQPSEARLGRVHFIVHPAQPSEVRLGRVHFIFRHIQICTRLLQGELFKVTMYTAHISSNGSHFGVLNI